MDGETGRLPLELQTAIALGKLDKMNALRRHTS
jgi:hypothetical protein